MFMEKQKRNSIDTGIRGKVLRALNGLAARLPMGDFGMSDAKP